VKRSLRHTDDLRSSESSSLSSQSRNGSTEWPWSNDRLASPSSPSASPLTPPDSPSFNATTASAFCRNVPGLVSFNDIEGLGCPPGMEDCDDDDDESARLGSSGKWGWLLPTGWIKQGESANP